MKAIHMRWSGARTWAPLLAAAGLVLLSGCTTYVTSRVTAFQNWPARDAGRTYAFVRTAGQSGLEYGSYEQLVGNELSAYGFRQVAPGAARYGVSLAYSVSGDTVVVPQPVYYDPYYAAWPGPYWRGWYGPAPMVPLAPAGYVNQAYRVYVKSLTIRMIDQATHGEVYSVTANTQGDDPALLPAMPYLVRSALTGFPLPNGTITQVRLPLGAPANPGAGAAAAAGPGASPDAAPQPVAPAAK